MQMPPHVYAQQIQTYTRVYCFRFCCNPHFVIHVALIVATTADMWKPNPEYVLYYLYICMLLPHIHADTITRTHTYPNKYTYTKERQIRTRCGITPSSSSRSGTAGHQRLQHCVIISGWLSTRSCQQAVTAWLKEGLKKCRPRPSCNFSLVWPN